jgi:hypothetical protein
MARRLGIRARSVNEWLRDIDKKRTTAAVEAEPSLFREVSVRP